MDTFQETVKERKALVPSSRKKKSGAKSKYVSLPHDNVRPETLNGPVKKFNIDEPMTWAEFKNLENHQQRLYIDRLTELYGPSLKMLSSMFGVAVQTIHGYFSSNAIKTGYKKGGNRATKTQLEMWNAFCNGVVGGGKKPEEVVQEILGNKETTADTEPVVTELVAEADQCMPLEEQTSTKEMFVDEASFVVSGAMDYAGLEQVLMSLIPAGAQVKLTIQIEKLK